MTNKENCHISSAFSGGEPSDSKESVQPSVVMVEAKDDASAAGKRKSDGLENAAKRPKLDAGVDIISIENTEDIVRECLKKKPTSRVELLEMLASHFSQSHSTDEIYRRLIGAMRNLRNSIETSVIEGAMHFVLRN